MKVSGLNIITTKRTQRCKVLKEKMIHILLKNEIKLLYSEN